MMATLFLICVAILLSLIVWQAVGMTVTISVTGPFLATDTAVLTDEASIVANPSAVPAAVAGSLTTRTSDTAGTLTMGDGHGITTGSRIDLYWDGGQAYGATVGTVSGNSVPFTTAAGSVMPIATTAVVVGKCVDVLWALTGDNLTAFYGYSAVRGYIVIADGSGSLEVMYLTAGKVNGWNNTQTATNPLAGDTPTRAFFSHSDTSGVHGDMALAALVHN